MVNIPAPHPTLADVASIAGVSIKTASRVLNDSINVAPETAEKVRQAAAQIGYRSNRIARELRGGALSNLIGMVISDLANPLMQDSLRELKRDSLKQVWTSSSLLRVMMRNANEHSLNPCWREECVDCLLFLPVKTTHI